jgi:hypothetical protein
MADAGILHGTALVLRLGPVATEYDLEPLPLDKCDFGCRSYVSQIVWLFEPLPVDEREFGHRLYTEFPRT